MPPARSVNAIIAEGRNCWMSARANRFRFLVDAAAFFGAFKAAALEARHSILIVGWSIDSRTLLEFPDTAREDVPNRLGAFLDHLAARNSGLQIRVLNWDSPLVYKIDREWKAKAYFTWFTHPNLLFAMDDQHPLGASHHQKIVVIDDEVAFVGGMDLAADRLDDPRHRLPASPNERPVGMAVQPTHDVQAVFDGPAATAVAQLARDRWWRATHEDVPEAAPTHGCWPEDLPVDLHRVDVAISRTLPAWKRHDEVKEIEALYVDAIAAAESNIYVETQYFSSVRVAQALIERLKRPDCPEIAMLLPHLPTGWLEQAAMGCRQREILARLRSIDEAGRFRVYKPVVGDRGDAPVKVHSKLMIVDGRFVTVGSANLNNRSMGLDTECNVSVEGTDADAVAQAVEGLRDRLLAEHLNRPVEEVSGMIAAEGSLVTTIERLRGPGRSLVPFPEREPNFVDSIVAGVDITDPVAISEPERIADDLATDGSSRNALRQAVVRLLVVIVALVALAALWRWGPASEYVDAAALAEWARGHIGSWRGVAILLAAYVVGAQLMFPILVLITATGLMYGAVAGFLIASGGAIMSAAIGYGLGLLLGRRVLRRLAGRRLERLSRTLARHGVLSMTVIRMLPVAPYALVNLAAGASQIRFRDFMIGTALGMAPGIAAITLFAGQLVETIRNPSVASFALLAGVVVVIAFAAFWGWRRFGWRAEDRADG